MCVLRNIGIGVAERPRADPSPVSAVARNLPSDSAIRPGADRDVLGDTLSEISCAIGEADTPSGSMQTVRVRESALRWVPTRDRVARGICRP